MHGSGRLSGKLVVLTGASGAGKTTLAKLMLDRASHHGSPEWQVFFFDSVGVPTVEEMQEQYGSGEQWQRAMTLDWMERIKPLLSSGRAVLFEGQMRIEFIREALASLGIADARIILVDCDDRTRASRLSIDRGQPELADPVMMNWARYLREEARAAGVEILDTGASPMATCVAYLMERLG